MDIKKEREAFNKEFGIDDADTFPAFSSGIESSAALKCNWLGWKKRAEIECKENPETIEIDGLKTIHKLCKFGAEHNMEGCSFTEIVERMFDELESAKAQSVPEGFKVVSFKQISELVVAVNKVDLMTHTEQKTNEARLAWQDIASKLQTMIEAQEPTND